jgi:hypothetical protein
MVLWNTRYTDHALTAVRAAGRPVGDDDDGARLSHRER